MRNAVHYYTRFQNARGGLTGLPPLARSIVTLFALPGIVLLLLSFIAGVVSIFVLLLLTVPVYRVLQAIFGSKYPIADRPTAENPFGFSLFGQALGNAGSVESADDSPGRRKVAAKVTDAEV